MMSLPEELKMPPGLAAPFVGTCRYLISLDFDGTLLSDETHSIESGFFEQMACWRAQGVRWGINTGRSLPYLMQDFQRFSTCLPDFICTCERYIYVADDMGRLCPNTAHNARCMDVNQTLCNRFAPYLHARMHHVRLAHPEWIWEYATDDPLSIEAMDAATMDALAPFVMQLIEQEEGIALQRAGRYLRLSDARYDKGSVLSTVAAYWNVLPCHVAIIGDGHNDLLAFKALPTAFCAAPSNAHPDVRAWLRSHGGYVSPERGVLQALRFWASRVFSMSKDTIY